MRGSTGAVLVAAFVVLAGCSPISAGAPNGRVRVVASTDVYGDIVRAIAGNRVQITSLIDNPAQDPHSFEADARSQLSLAKADVIIENGGGYDDFVDRMRAASGRAQATVVNVVRLSGKIAPPDGDLNEHVWYDLPTMARLAYRIAVVLAGRDRPDAATFHTHAARFIAALHRLERLEASIRAQSGGTAVAITEPVPTYLLQACGLIIRTPSQFSAAMEADSDVSAAVLQRTLELFTTHAITALVYNAQTSGVETTRLRAAARAERIPAVAVTETLPAGLTYLGWMRANLVALERAVHP